jgi:hypothetical protein
MSLTLSFFYQEPGVYVVFNNSVTPAVPVGFFVPGAFGVGKKTYTVRQTLTRGATVDSSDGPLSNNPVVEINAIQDQNGVVYQNGVSFCLSRTSTYPFVSKVSWALTAQLIGTTAGTYTIPATADLYLTVDGVNYTVNLSSLVGTGVTAAAVATAINAAAVPGLTAAVNSGGGITLFADSVTVNTGSNSIHALFGFSVGQFASVSKPAAGTQYQVTYTYVKPSSAYTSKLFVQQSDYYSEYGQPMLQTVVYAQTTPTTVGGTANTLTDSSNPFQPISPAVLTSSGSPTFSPSSSNVLYLVVNNFPYSVAFAGTETTAALCAAKINTVVPGVASVSGSNLVLSANQIKILTGANDASTTLGFFVGQNATSSTPVDITGMYVKIASGDGSNQMRVILAFTPGQLTIGEAWTINPDNTSQYQVLSGPDYSIPLGLDLTNANGSAYFIGSQAPDNIFNSTNLIAALNSMQNAQQTGGYWPYVVLYMNGLHTTDSNQMSTIQQFVDNNSGPLGRQEMIAIVGTIANDTNSLDFISIASGFADSRVTLVAPSDAQYSLPNGTVTVDGSYLAAALAGIVVNPLYDAAEPISGKVISGFNSINDQFTRLVKNQMAGNGVTILEVQNGPIVIRHALTTSVTSAITQELKVQRIQDFSAAYFRNNLQAAYKNVRNTGAVLKASITNTVKILATNLVEQVKPIWSAFDPNFSVVNNLTEPRQWDITIKYVPVFDVNWITLTLGATISL